MGNLQKAMAEAADEPYTPPPEAPAPVVKAKEIVTPEESQVAPATLTEQFKAGQLSLPRGVRVPVKLASGEIGTVEPQDAQSIVDSGGELITHEEHKEYKLDQANDNPRNQIVSGIQKAASAATLGASDAALLALTPKHEEQNLRDQLASYNRIFPVTNTVGTIAGIAGPALLGDEASLGSIGKVLTAPIKGVGMLGEAVSRIVPATAPALVKKTVQFAVEGAVFGGAQEADEQMLGDEKMNAEKILAAMGPGAIMGAGFGVGAHLGGKAAAALGKGSAESMGKVQPYLRGKAQDYAWASLGASGKYAKKAASQGGTRAVAQELFDLGVFEGANTREKLAANIQKAREEIGAKLGEITDASSGQVDATKLVNGMLGNISERAAKAGHGGIANSMGEYAQDLWSKLGVKFENGVVVEGQTIPVQRVIEQRQALDDLAFKESKALDPKLRVEELRNFREMIAKLEIEAVEKAAPLPGAGAELDKVRKQYGKLALADKALGTKSSSGFETMLHRFGPLGALATGHPLLAAELYSMKLVREGSPLLARHLMKMAGLMSIAKRVEMVDAHIAQAAEEIFNKPPQAAKVEAEVKKATSAPKTEYDRTKVTAANPTVKNPTEAPYSKTLPAGKGPKQPEMSISQFMGEAKEMKSSMASTNREGNISNAKAQAKRAKFKEWLKRHNLTEEQFDKFGQDLDREDTTPEQERAAYERWQKHLDPKSGYSSKYESGTFNKKGPLPIPPDAEERFKQHAETGARHKAHPGATEAAAQKAFADLEIAAPKTAAAFKRAAVQAGTKLAQQRPDPVPVQGALPGTPPTQPSAKEKYEYSLYAQANQDPLGEITRIKNGRVTASGLKGLGDHAAILGRFQEELSRQLTKANAEGRPLDYNIRKITGQVLKRPALWIQQPHAVQGIQLAIASPPMKENPKSQGPKRPVSPAPGMQPMTTAVGMNAGGQIRVR